MPFTTQSTILLLGAKSTNLSAVPKELRTIKQLFNDNNANKHLFQLEYEPYFTQEELKKLLDRLTDQVSILHFAGHSNAIGLQTDDKLVYSRHIAEIIKNWSIQPTLIFLNGCRNQQQVELFLDAGVANIIATHRQINDQHASQFALEFYASLFTKNAGLPLQIAFKQAGEKVFLDKAGAARSLDFESLDQTNSDNWDWGLFEKYPNTEQQWTLKRLLSEDRPRFDQKGSLINPYKGLVAFKEEDKSWFFGRDALAQELVQAIQQSHFYTLLGASGSGKSSLINAAVIPQLRHGASPDVRLESSSLILRANPANAPFAELVDVFAEHLYPDSLAQRLKEQKQLTQQLQEQQISVNDLVNSLLKKTDKNRLYLCIDQFEELFTQSQQPIIQAFLQQLIQFINAKTNCCLILIMRADFLASALANSEFAALMDQHPHKLLAPMSKAELREAIEKPANKQRIKIQPALLEALLDDIEDQPGYLPLLQYSLNLLWEKRQSNTIQLKHYNALGGLKKVLETRANKIFQAFSEQQKEYCKQIFLRLIQPGEGTEDTCRRACLDEFDQQHELQATLKTLADARLITTEQDSESKQAYVEISHEALIKYWPQLREWIAENRDELRIQHQISADAKEWKQQDYYSDWLLNGSRLMIANEWLDKNIARATLLEKEFIQKGVEEQDKQAKAKEKQRKRNRDVLVGFLVMISMIALFALTQWQRANKSRVIADNKTEIAEQETQKAKKAKEETEQKILESNFFLAKSYEQKALLALARGDQAQQKGGNKSIDEYQKAWLYAFEAKKIELPKGKIALKQTSLMKLTNISAQAISQERNIIPSILDKNRFLNIVVYSPDGKMVASLSHTLGTYQDGIKLWDVKSGELKKTLRGYMGRVDSIAYSPDGKMLASASNVLGLDDGSGGQVQLWDIKSGELKQTLKGGHTDIVNSVAYSPDGKMLASSSDDNSVGLWDAKSGELKRTLKGHTDTVNSVTYSPDGKMLASASSDNSVRLWDAKSGELKKTLKGHTDDVNSVTYSPDGKMVVSASRDKSVRFWDAKSGELKKTLKGHTGYVNSVTYSPDGKMVVSASRDKSVRFWDAKSGELKKTLKGHTGSVNSVAYIPDGKMLASTSDDGSVRLWNAKSGELMQTIMGYINNLHSADFSIEFGNSEVLSSALDDNSVRFRDVKTGKLTQTLKGHSNAVLSVAYSHDGKMLASASYDESVRLWDAKSGKLKKVLKGHTGAVTSVTYSPDGKMLASSSDDNSVRLWDAKSGKLKKILKGHTGAVTSVTYSPDGKMLASASSDNSVRLWDAKSGKLKKILKGYTSYKTSVAYSPDGKVLVVASGGSTVKLWDTKSDELKLTISGHIDDEINSAVYSPDGKMLATALGNVHKNKGDVRLWDAKSGKLKQTLKGHTEPVNSVAYSPDGKMLASASWDKSVRLWDTKSGELRQTLKGHSDGVLSVAYSPDGKVLVSTSVDGNIHIWDNNQFTTLKLFYDFAPKQVSDTLKFLWELGLDKENFEFIHQVRTPTLYPKQGYYYSDVQFRPLLDMPRENESKMDQLVRFLEDRCAYKDKAKVEACEK